MDDAVEVLVTLSCPLVPTTPETFSLPSRTWSTSGRGFAARPRTSPAPFAVAIRVPAGPVPCTRTVMLWCGSFSVEPSRSAPVARRPSAAVTAG